MYDGAAVIYADILFIINFCIDFLCLFITDRLLNRSGRFYRIALGAVGGGLYTFLPYFINLSPIFALILHISAAALICLIAFGFEKFITTALTFTISEALMGGLITAIFNLSSQYGSFGYGEISASSFCVVCIISALISLLYGLICRKRVNTLSAEIRIYIGNSHFDVRLLTDSGNLVTEPFSSLPVIIVVSSALPPPYDRPQEENYPLSLRAIPFRTGAGMGCFWGIKPDKIELRRLSKKPKSINAYIGIDVVNSHYSGYDGLMPNCLL